MNDKQLVSALCDLFEAIVRDASAYEQVPLADRVLYQDVVSLRGTAKNRGLDVLTISLPSISSDLERSLELGVYERTYTGPLSSLATNGFPRFLNSLYVPIFDEDVDNGTKIENVRLLRQLLRFAKKFDIQCTDDRKEKAIDAFYSIEKCTPEPILAWGSDDLYSSQYYTGPGSLSLLSAADRAITRHEELGGLQWDGIPYVDVGEYLEDDIKSVQRCADCFSSNLPDRFAAGRSKHGPGAVSETYGDSKYEFPGWPSRLECEYPFSDYGPLNWASEDNLADPSFSDVSAKLIAVPKDQKGPRLIASEPISAQYIQQGIMSDLRRAVRRSFLRGMIDFHSQEKNQMLALTGTRGEGHSTIDLSSASDRLSTSVVEAMFRMSPALLRSLNAARTPTVRCPGRDDLALNKFAAQGAAFTFPVQTIVYSLVCLGVLARVRYPEHSTFQVLSYGNLAEEMSVYGDDMVVVTDAFHRTCNVLTALGLVVNADKSFTNGFFRESCGVDAYMGHNVSPIYVRKLYDGSANSLQSVVDTSNSFFEEGYPSVSATLLRAVPPEIIRKIYRKELGETRFGIYDQECLPAFRAVDRWNESIQRREYKVLVVETKVKRSIPNGQLQLRHWLENASRRRTNPDNILERIPVGEVVQVKSTLRLQWVLPW